MIWTKSQQGISFTSRGQVLVEGTLGKAPVDGHEKILRIAEEWVPALKSGNIERNMAFFTEDVLVAGGGKDEVYVGREKVRGLLAHHLESFNITACSFRVLSVNIAKGWAELRGEFRAVWQPKKQGVAEEKEFSNYVWVLKRQPDGLWKIARFLFYPAE
jgi:ketosteroid isomerase-like protein